MTDWSKVQLGTLPVSTRTGAIQTPPAIETTPPEYVGGNVNFFIPQHKSPTLTVGDKYYTNNPDKSKAYSDIPSFMTWG